MVKWGGTGCRGDGGSRTHVQDVNPRASPCSATLWDFAPARSEWRDRRRYRRLSGCPRRPAIAAMAPPISDHAYSEADGHASCRRWRLIPRIRQPCGTRPRRHFSSAGWIYVLTGVARHAALGFCHPVETEYIPACRAYRRSRSPVSADAPGGAPRASVGQSGARSPEAVGQSRYRRRRLPDAVAEAYALAAGAAPRAGYPRRAPARPAPV